MHKLYLRTIHHFFPELNSLVKKNSRSQESQEDRISTASIILDRGIAIQFQIRLPQAD